MQAPEIASDIFNGLTNPSSSSSLLNNSVQKPLDNDDSQVVWGREESTWHGMSETDGDMEVVNFERTVVSVWHEVLEIQQGEKGIYSAGQ